MSAALLLLALAGSLAGYVAWRKRPVRARLRGELRSLAAPGSLRALGLWVELGEMVGIGQREYWLVEGFLAKEDGRVLAAVFFVETERLVVPTGPEPQLFVGREVSVQLPAELPTSLVVAGVEFGLRGRFPVVTEALGSHEKAPLGPGLWGEYRGGTDAVLWVLRQPQGVSALMTRQVHPSELSRWGMPSE